MKTPKTSYADGPDSMNLVTMRKRLDALDLHRDHDLVASVEVPTEVEDFEVDRRDFFKIASGAAALAGLTACTKQPIEKIIPYVDAPEDLLPGRPLFYASSFTKDGYGYPVLVESHMGRPTNIEGNPDHPFGNGGTDIYTTASILDMYNPDRSQSVLRNGRSGATVSQFQATLAALRPAWDANKGEGVAVLIEQQSSPTLEKVIKAFSAKYPKASFYNHNPAQSTNAAEGLKKAFGKAVTPRYNLAKAKRILDVDANLLGHGAAMNQHLADWSSQRNLVEQAVVSDDHGAHGGGAHGDAGHAGDAGHESKGTHSAKASAGEADKQRGSWGDDGTHSSSHGAPMLAKADMNRLYCIETNYSITGAAAEHRLTATPSRIAELFKEIARGLGVAVAGQPLFQHVVAGGHAEVDLPSDSEYAEKFVTGVIADLKAHAGECVIALGERHSAELHAMAGAINKALGNVGQTVDYVPSSLIEFPNSGGDLTDLTKAIEGNKVESLFILDSNPVYSAPADLNFKSVLTGIVEPSEDDETKDDDKKPRGDDKKPEGEAKAEKASEPVDRKLALVMHAGLFADETAACANWHLPLAHFLEAWGDVRSPDGTYSSVQPLIQPLYSSALSLVELFGILADETGTSAADLVKETAASAGAEGDDAWQTLLHDGFIAGSAAKAASVRTPHENLFFVKSEDADEKDAPAVSGDTELEVLFEIDPAAWDGRFTNNAWLQEMSNPITTLTWDNAIAMSPQTAKDLGFADAKKGYPNRTAVEPKTSTIVLTVGDRTVEGALLIQPGHANGAITVTLGHGRETAGPLGSNTGYNAYTIRTSDNLWITKGTAVKGKGMHKLAMCQDHFQMQGRTRNHIRTVTLDAIKEDSHAVQHLGHKFPKEFTLYPPPEEMLTDSVQWGMTIDLTRCVGCSACQLACNSENNTSVVGRNEVLRGREMHWMRIDRFYENGGDPFRENVRVRTQPVACVHCENAPCETVCPVGATVHSNDGMNQMVYNRCVGTRYCSNNCPYKVRRFNYLQYYDYNGRSAQENMMQNPNVTTRVRGVMEKCTYCVQRVNAARIEAKKEQVREGLEELPLKDGAVITACQSACPTNAISFGNISDPESEVSKVRRLHDLTYGLLSEVNTRPRTLHLARILNWNPDVEAAPAAGHKSGPDIDEHGGDVKQGDEKKSHSDEEKSEVHGEKA